MTMFFTRLMRLCHSLALLTFVLPAVLPAQDASGVGFSAITVHDPVNGGNMPGYVFYPSSAPPGVTSLGPYRVAATADAPAIPGARPLVVISHGHGGSDLGHHDLATYLASHGFVVATIEHARDNFHDSSGNAHVEVLAGRPMQISATISMLLKDPHWSELIAPDRIGVAGFSAGGYTSLVLVGAVPRFGRFIGYCQRHPGDEEVCGIVKQLATQAGETAQKALDDLQRDYARMGRLDDARVRAAFAMAPLSVVFDTAGLATINRPVFLYYGQSDHVLLPQENVLHIAPLIKTLVNVKMVPKAGHYVFLAPCSPELTKEAPDICRDPPGVSRVGAHAQIDADALAFFRKTLVVPTSALNTARKIN